MSAEKVVDPYELPPIADAVESMETQKPIDLKATLAGLNHAASQATYAMATAILAMEAVPKTAAPAAFPKACEDMRKAHAELKKMVDESIAIVGPKEHVLKADHAPFRAVWSGQKPYEVRRFDRDFRVGDVLKLLEHDRETGRYSGAKMKARITYVTKPGEYGLPADTGVLGIEVLDKKEA